MSEMNVGAGPVRKRDPEELAKRVRLDLWKATWEASQVMTYMEIHDYVASVLREIQADEP